MSIGKNHLTCSLLEWYDYTSLSLKEEMPMENIKESLSSVVHHWTAIAVATMFLFSNSNTVALAQAEIVKPKTEVQLKKETLEKYSNTVYKPSEMLTDSELIELLSTVGFEGKALKTAWAIAKRESNGRPLAYNGNRATGDSSYGIFQINMLGNLGVDRKEKFNLKSNESLFDPTKNAEIAYYMTNGGSDWSAWKGLTPRAMEFYLKFPNN